MERHILILFGSFFCDSEFTGFMFTTARSRNVKVTEESRGIKKLSVIITFFFFNKKCTNLSTLFLGEEFIMKQCPFGC